MSRNYSIIYRICLLAAVILTIAGGIFYYVNYVENQSTVTEGTLVRNTEGITAADSRNEIPCEDMEEETAVESFRPFGSTIKSA